MDERVERGMRRQLASIPADRIGWKMALNAPAIMEALGLEEPALGWLSRAQVADGEHSLAGSTQPAVEPELLLEAGADGGVARIGVALEVVDLDRSLDDVEEVIAANIFHRAVAPGDLGPVTEPGEAVFSLNGQERARIGEFEPAAQTLAFVGRFLGELGEELRPGDLVIAGALAPAAPVADGDVAELEVGRVGAISLRFGSM
jgi:2-keto-4-pentenoate hydratase